MSTSKPKVWEVPEDDARLLSDSLTLMISGSSRVCGSVREIEGVLSHHVRYSVSLDGSALVDVELLRDEYDRVGELLNALESGVLAPDDPELEELVFSPCAIQAEWAPIISTLLSEPTVTEEARLLGIAKYRRFLALRLQSLGMKNLDTSAHRDQSPTLEPVSWADDESDLAALEASMTLEAPLRLDTPLEAPDAVDDDFRFSLEEPGRQILSLDPGLDGLDDAGLEFDNEDTFSSGLPTDPADTGPTLSEAAAEHPGERSDDWTLMGFDIDSDVQESASLSLDRDGFGTKSTWEGGAGVAHGQAAGGLNFSNLTLAPEEPGPHPSGLELLEPDDSFDDDDGLRAEPMPVGNGWVRIARNSDTELDLGGRRTVEIMLADHRFRLRCGSRPKLTDPNGQVAYLRDGSNRVGRSPDGEIKVDQSYTSISRCHLTIHFRDGKLAYLRDSSGHGTFVPAWVVVEGED